MSNQNGQSGVTLEQWSSGEVIRASKLNQPVDELNRMRTVRPPQQVFSEGGGGGAGIACKIVTIGRNHLTCTKVSDSSTIQVAKPKSARAPGSDVRFGNGYTYVYTSPFFDERDSTKVGGGAVEKQIVWEEYNTGDEIVAMRMAGGTGVMEAPDLIEESSLRGWAERPLP